MSTITNMNAVQLPNDFVKKMKNLLGEEWEAFWESYENDRYQALRFNPLKEGIQEEDYEQLLRTLNIEETEPVLWTETGFYYGQEAHPGKHAYHEAGVYYIQEPSAMAPAAMLPVQPGMRVLDLCAAPGGKSTQIAGKLLQEGLLVSNEIHPARCKILSQNMERLGVRNVIVTNEDSKTLADHFPCFFHGIMVDAPCSGEGMFRKNPEAMQEWSLDQVAICADRQLEILGNAANMLVKGGVMAYSTCTFSPEENEQVIAAFLEEHPDFYIEEINAPWFSPGNSQWSKPQPLGGAEEGKSQAMGTGESDKPQTAEASGEIEKTFRLWPHKLHGEGHFLAILRKKGTLELENSLQQVGAEEANQAKVASLAKEDRSKGKKAKKNKKPALEKDQLAQLQEFADTVLSEEMAQWILQGELTMFGENLYRLPAEAPSLRGIKVLRSGLQVGTFKKNRFEPAHALAMTLGTKDVKLAVSVSEEKANAYLRGESLMVEEGEVVSEEVVSQGKECQNAGRSGKNAASKGWCLVCVDGFSMGWGKMNGVQIKNHYPKGLRRPY